MPPSILQGDTAKPGGGWELKGHFLDGVYYSAGVQSDREMPILLQISADASGI